MITNSRREICVFWASGSQKALQSKLLKPADTAMAEWPFEPSLDSIFGMRGVFFLISHTSKLCDSFVYLHVPSSILI